MTSLRDLESDHQDIVKAIAMRDAHGIEQAASRMNISLKRIKNAGAAALTDDDAQRAAVLRGQIATTRMHINMMSHVLRRQSDAIAELTGHQAAIAYRRL